LNEELKLLFLKLPNLQKVVDILDPDRQNIPHFYIYSSYSEQLQELRSEHKRVLIDQPDAAEEIRLQALQIEDAIREELSEKLITHVPSLQSALEMVAHLDIVIAKAKQATIWGLAKPVIAKNCTTFKGLFNPQVKCLLEEQQKIFQPIDIDLKSAPCLITGVNMGGKTVLLKTIGLAQFLFQFGFYVPAAFASMVIVDQILMSIGDEQSELNGLSSFAAEMMNVDEIIRKSKAEKQILVLIDELARTTNPEEGKAIVNATLDILSQHNIRSLVTTHYSGLNWNGRKLRVKGLLTEKLTDQLTAKNINDYMDYSLVENDLEIMDKQALQIARLLGVDEELLEKAFVYMKR
jgi:DNA mismatch repair protein MutS2